MRFHLRLSTAITLSGQVNFHTFKPRRLCISVLFVGGASTPLEIFIMLYSRPRFKYYSQNILPYLFFLPTNFKCHHRSFQRPTSDAERQTGTKRGGEKEKRKRGNAVTEQKNITADRRKSAAGSLRVHRDVDGS